MRHHRFVREMTIDSRPNNVPQIIDFIAHACHECSVSSTDQFDLQLAVEEACCNVVQHAYAGQGGELKVQFEVRGEDVVVTVRDRGKACDPILVAKPDLSASLDDRPLGGLGLHLMHQVMDEVEFKFSVEQGNTLVMVKRAAAPEPPECDEQSSH